MSPLPRRSATEHPGEWKLIAALTLLVAAAGATASIALSSGGDAKTTKTTTVSTTTTTPAVSTTTTAPKTTTTKVVASGKPIGATGGTDTLVGRGALTSWPTGRDAWTVVLGSYPIGRPTDVPIVVAMRAAKTLKQVGVLNSTAYSSLRPNYWVVFAGIYSSQAPAQAAVSAAHTAGFTSAYPRHVTR